MSESTDGMNGVQLIAAERQRQITEEGYTAVHDDSHTHGEIAVQAAVLAAARLATDGTDARVEHPDNEKGFVWPGWYDKSEMEEMGPIRKLVIAGALIAAEIDRMQREGGER